MEYFNKAYNIARATNDREMVNSYRVQFGIAAAHKMIGNISTHMEVAPSSKPAIIRLIDWKDNRNEEFDKPIPDSAGLCFSYLYLYSSQNTDFFHKFVQCSQTFANIKTMYKSLQ